MTRFRRGVLGAVLLFAVGCAEHDAPWNVLVLVPDTLRADHITPNGYVRNTTPTLARLALEGANFSQAITVAPRTWQSFSSILTGLYPPHHGVRYIFDRPIPAETPTVGSLLGAQGWETAAFDTGVFLRAMTDSIGFDDYLVPKPHPDEDKDDAVVRAASAWMTRERSAPFLAFVRLAGSHWPYATERESVFGQECADYDHDFNEGTYGITAEGVGKGVKLRDEVAFRRLIWTVDPDAEVRAHIVAHYDAEVAATDAKIGRVIETLRASGLLERTIVVITSDHGESFGEHGYLQHGPRIDEAVVRVPLLIRFPASHPASHPGRSIDGLVRTVDILPTLLDALGVPTPSDLDGISLLPAIAGGVLPELWAYAETGRSFMGVDPERVVPGIRGKHRMIRTAKWKLVYRPRNADAEYRLFDITEDPEERVDVAAGNPDVVSRLRMHLDEIVASEVRRDDRQLSAEEIEKLRELGYVQ